jgi:sorbitol-specific phosphotransferase system component IIC
MIDWIVEKILSVAHWVPALFLEEGSVNHDLVRAMFALLLLTLVVYALVMLAPRSGIARFIRKLGGILSRKR